MCLRTDEESLGFRRTDEESLGFSKDRRAISRDMPLGGSGLHRLSGTSRPRGLRLPSRGQSGRRGRLAAPRRGRWTGHGLAGGRGQARRREGHPPWQPGGRGAGGRPRPLDGAWLLPGQGQPPQRPCGHRRLPWPQEPSGIAVLAGRAPRASGRQRLASVERPGFRGEEGGMLPGGLHGARACRGRTDGRRGDHGWGDHGCMRCGPGDAAEGHPPTAEEQPEPEEEGTDAPETAGTAMPFAPLLQEGRDVVEGGRGMHRPCSSLWGSARVWVPRPGPVAPARGTSLDARRTLYPLPSQTVLARGARGGAQRLQVSCTRCTNPTPICQVFSSFYPRSGIAMPDCSIALGGALLCRLTPVARVPDSLPSSHTAPVTSCPYARPCLACRNAF